ncbi:hypothetical protein GOB13_28705 [Sinorhizobium meliloti]|uniref:proline racemase family protein n=1 Tax=Rhizobium meliloti TaxID=382 RepID=UPI000B49EE91|nr:hypothetical protein CDO23_21765 [Sinorhizobium meliloti]MDW9794338.1 hypothetical protein [Sinorhizobium meliloti]MDW9831519.1 hypothetical protein [Sinorhizobium meliloti]MDX0066901.1 hypothetical protein [Sinorhizobium meliloti]MDX0085239.1 hypothetical protein [Sinorhizobium meliloti]
MTDPSAAANTTLVTEPIQRPDKAAETPTSFCSSRIAPTRRRIPSGTGTSAHIALRHVNTLRARSIIPFIQESTLGLYFTATAKSHPLPTGNAVLPTIGTKSYLMGVHQLYIDRRATQPLGTRPTGGLQIDIDP